MKAIIEKVDAGDFKGATGAAARAELQLKEGLYKAALAYYQAVDDLANNPQQVAKRSAYRNGEVLGWSNAMLAVGFTAREVSFIVGKADVDSKATTDAVIYQELGQTTDAAIEYRCSHGGGYYLTTDLLLTGRGIKMSGDGKDHARGKKTYHVTAKAFEKIKAQHTTCYLASM